MNSNMPNLRSQGYDSHLHLSMGDSIFILAALMLVFLETQIKFIHAKSP